MNCKVFFASNSYVPSIEEQNKLKSFLIFPDSIFIATIQLNGYSDDIGKNSYNDSLAARRVEEIKKTIISCHINPAIITKTLTKGEVELNVSARDSEKQRSANRRVDVIVELDSRVKKEIVVEKPIVRKREPLFAPEPIVEKKVAFIPVLIPDSVKVGDNYKLENIYFEMDRSTLLPSSNNTLELLFKVLNEKKSIEILILGHVCCLPEGEDATDKNTKKKNLSVARAKAVHDYLIGKGISDKRVSYLGMKANKKTGKGANLDRRVEIEIIKK